MTSIVTLTETPRRSGARGDDMPACGYRIFLVAPALAHPCERMPIPLDFFPNPGTKARDSFTWFEPRIRLGEAPPCRLESSKNPKRAQLHVECRVCLAGHNMPLGPHGVLWVDADAYPSRADFVQETRLIGVSVEISPFGAEHKTLPSLVFGETVVYIAHRFAIEMKPGIIAAFRPTGVDFVIGSGEDARQAWPATAALGLARQIGKAARVAQVTSAPERSQGTCLTP